MDATLNLINNENAVAMCQGKEKGHILYKTPCPV